MTENEAQNFVKEVLQGFYPRWNPNDEELRGWLDRLKNFDFYKAKITVNNLFFNQESRGIDPPAGKIIKALKAKAYIPKAKFNNEPVLLYEIVKESSIVERQFKHPKTGEMTCCTCCNSQGFFENANKIPCKEEIERQAETMRDKFNDLYKENHLIFYNKLQQEEKGQEAEEIGDIPF